jgi:uncharacterized membrane protein
VSAAASRAAWLLLALLATAIGLASLRYLGGDVAVAPAELRPNFAARPIWFMLHTGAGAAALLVLPWQLSATLRGRRPGLHRLLGRVYVGAVAASGVAAVPVALGSFAGPVAAAGFVVLAIAWLATTGLAFAAIRAGDVAAHRRWMIRSAALTMAAITLRLYLPVPPALGLSFAEGYRIIAWACWVPNLLAAELAIRSQRPLSAPRRAAICPAQEKDRTWPNSPSPRTAGSKARARPTRRPPAPSG